MDNIYAIIQAISNFISPFNLIKKLAIFTFPLWLLYKFAPMYYANIKNAILLKPTNYNELIAIIKFLFYSLVYINYFFIILLFIIIAAKIIQRLISLISSIFTYIDPLHNDFRENLFMSIGKLYFQFSIYIVSISIYSDLLLNYSIPLKIIYTSKVYCISIVPFFIVIIVFIISLILPDNLLEDFL